MAKWKSNGDNYSPNESLLLGERVVLRQGNREWIGILKMVRAQTRGNTTIAVVSTGPIPEGRTKRHAPQPLWTLRKRPFTLERYVDPEPTDSGKAVE